MSPYVPPAVAQARALADELRGLVGGFELATLLGHEATMAVEVFATIKDLAAHAELLAAGVVTERHAWKSSGEPSAAHWLARVSGVGLSEAGDVLSTARRLADVPSVDTAARAGRLSRTECVAITDAGTVNPGAVPVLLGAVGTESTAELRDRCLTAKAAARDPEAHQQALHKQRSLRTRTDAEGAFCLSWRATPEMGADFMSALDPFVDQQFRTARAEGRIEPAEVIAADGLAAMAAATLPGKAAAGVAGEPDPVGDETALDAPSSSDVDDTDDGSGEEPNALASLPMLSKRRPPTKIIVRVDLPALLRGHPIDGEVCEIPGYGPMPVAVLHEWLPEASIAIVLTKGVDVVNVTHLGRKSTAHQQTALAWIQPRCAVKGCARRARLETDHREDWHRTHHTRLDELDRLCSHHHDLKSLENWQLVAGRGRRPMVAPDHPEHPHHSDRTGTAA